MVIFKEWLDRVTVLSLCIMIFTLPFSKSALEVFFIIALTSWAIKRMLSHHPHTSWINIFKPASTGLNLPIFLFIISAIISTFDTFSFTLSVKGFFFKLMEGLVAFFIIAETINSRDKLKLILITILLSIVLMVVDGIFQLAIGWDFIRHYRITGWDYALPSFLGGKRMNASFLNPNGFGGWLTVMIPIVLGIGFIPKRELPGMIRKSIVWTLAGLMTLCLIASGSKGAQAGFTFAILLFTILMKRRVLVFVIAFILILSILIIPCFINISSAFTVFVKEVAMIKSSDQALTFMKDFIFSAKKHLVSIMLERDIIRANLWRQSLLIIKDFPLFGCGLNTYSIVAPRYENNERGSGTYPHNSYLQMAAETGIVGLASFLLVIISLFAVSFKNMKKIKSEFYINILIGLLAGLFGFLVHSFFDVNFYALQLANLMWFIMGLIMAVQKIALEGAGYIEGVD